MPAELPTAPAAGRRAALFGIDVRSLACFRIGLGLLLLWDLWGRARTLREHYTGLGAYPRGLAEAMRPAGAEAAGELPFFRLFLLSDDVAVQGALFALFALLALLFVLGWRTRVVSVLCFVFLAALVRRNHWVCHTGDVWLKALFFWAMFLPLGAHLSLDRLRSRWRAPPPGPVLSPASAAILLQIAIFYVSAGYLKARYDVWQRGEAVWIFTHVVEYTRPFGAWLGQFPRVCSAFTHGTLVLEGLVPFLFFVPFGMRVLRILLVGLFTFFHLTLQATIHIGIFQLMCIAALTLFLPGEFWGGLGARLPRGLRARWAALVAATRARWGRVQSEPAPAPGPLHRAGRRVGAALVGLALLVVLVSNVNSALEDPYDPADRGVLPLPATVDAYGRQMSLVQSWNMFTDIDRLFFGWFLVLGQQEDGAFVDVLAGEPFQALVFPAHYARFFPNHNSRRYWRELAFPEREFLQKPMCDYLAREWAAAGRSPLTHLAIFHVGRVPAEKRAADQVKRICVWEAPHQPLKEAAPELRELWGARRASWNRFLDGLPKTVP